MDTPLATEKIFRKNLVEEFQEYVHAVVGRLMRAVNLPTHMEDEFVAAGYLGLVEAASRFDRDSGKKFKSYAFLRIRGAVIAVSLTTRTGRITRTWLILKPVEVIFSPLATLAILFPS